MVCVLISSPFERRPGRRLLHQDLPGDGRLGAEADRERERANPRDPEGVGREVHDGAQKYTMLAVAIASLLTPRAWAASTSAAKTTRFSTALSCAFIMRRAHGDCGFGLSGYPTASMRPRVAIRVEDVRHPDQAGQDGHQDEIQKLGFHAFPVLDSWLRSRAVQGAPRERPLRTETCAPGRLRAPTLVVTLPQGARESLHRCAASIDEKRRRRAHGGTATVG